MGFQSSMTACRGWTRSSVSSVAASFTSPFEQSPDVVQAGDVVRPQGNLEARQIGDGFGHGLQGGLLFFV